MRLPPFRLWPRVPRRTIRMRLVLSYWTLSLASGAILLILTVTMWQESRGSGVAAATGWSSRPPSPVDPSLAAQHGADLQQLMLVSGIALAVMAALSVAFGWLLADRFLRPLRTITSTTRAISATNLHERLHLAGPDDDLKELGDTFDDLLARLERSFQFERQFVASASHELRTPLATMRVSLDVAMAKPGPIHPQTATLAARLRNELDHIDRLIESFLTLAHAQQGLVAEQSALWLDDLVGAAIERRAAAIASMGLEIDRQERPDARIQGSATLLSRMVENVIDNAIHHNITGGWIRIRTTVDGRVARLIVENGGPVLDQDQVELLGQPFRRLGAERTGSDKGTGLGLSIVRSIADVHGGTLALHALGDGGLGVVITLPRAAGTVAGAPA